MALSGLPRCISLIYCLFILLFSLLSIANADEYVLVMSKDDIVCQHMLKLYNADMKKYGQVKYDTHKEFTAIKWEEKKTYTTYPDGRKNYSIPSAQTALVSRFDINNDRTEEIVIRDNTWFNSILSENLLYFNNNSPVFDNENEINVFIAYQKAARKIETGPRATYELKMLPQFVYKGINDKPTKAYHSLNTFLFFRPFYFNDTYYVDMKDDNWPFDKATRKYSSKFLVILKFTKDNQSTDTCYFLRKPRSKNTPKGGK